MRMTKVRAAGCQRGGCRLLSLTPSVLPSHSPYQFLYSHFAFRLVLAEHLRLKAADAHRWGLPHVFRKPGFFAQVGEVLFLVPVPLYWHLRKQETGCVAVVDDEPVAAHLYLLGVF